MKIILCDTDNAIYEDVIKFDKVVGDLLNNYFHEDEEDNTKILTIIVNVFVQRAIAAIKHLVDEKDQNKSLEKVIEVIELHKNGS